MQNVLTKLRYSAIIILKIKNIEFLEEKLPHRDFVWQEARGCSNRIFISYTTSSGFCYFQDFFVGRRERYEHDLADSKF